MALLESVRYYPSVAAALDDLSAACVAFGRAQAKSIRRYMAGTNISAGMLVYVDADNGLVSPFAAGVGSVPLGVAACNLSRGSNLRLGREVLQRGGFEVPDHLADSLTGMLYGDGSPTPSRTITVQQPRRLS